MGNANNKTSRSCVPGANNSDKAQTGTMDERIDALVLRLHEVLSFSFFSFSFERVLHSSAPSRFFFSSPERESLKKCKQKTFSLSLSFRVFFFFYFSLFVSQFCWFVRARLSTVEEGEEGEGETRR
jgi:hypothetical protein